MRNHIWYTSKLNNLNPQGPTTLTYFCMNHGDQRVCFNLKSSYPFIWIPMLLVCKHDKCFTASVQGSSSDVLVLWCLKSVPTLKKLKWITLWYPVFLKIVSSIRVNGTTFWFLQMQQVRIVVWMLQHRLLVQLHTYIYFLPQASTCATTRTREHLLSSTWDDSLSCRQENNTTETSQGSVNCLILAALTLGLLNCLFLLFIHLKLEFVTQSPTSIDKKICLFILQIELFDEFSIDLSQTIAVVFSFLGNQLRSTFIYRSKSATV